MAKAKKRKTKWYPGKLLEAVTGAKKRRLKKAYEAEHPKLINAKEMAKERASGAGRVRKGAVGVKSTKGGEYVKYGKKSKAAKSFRGAFAEARKAGKSTFTWDGRKYSTARADDKKKVAKPKGKGVTVSSVGKKYKKPIDKKGMQVTQSAITQSMKGKKKDKVLAVKKPSNPPLTLDALPLKGVRDLIKGVKNIPKHAKDWKNITDKNVDQYKKDNPDKYPKNKMEEGGKVESSSNGDVLFNWPTKDARNGGNK